MTDQPHIDALAADQHQHHRSDPRAHARVVIAETTQVLTSRRATLAEHAAAYRRRAQAWTELADAVPYDQQLTPTMRQAAADDHARADTLSSRTPIPDYPHRTDFHRHDHHHDHDHRHDHDRRDGPEDPNSRRAEHGQRGRAGSGSGHEH